MRRPRRSVVRTPGFHPGNGGSIPLGVAIKLSVLFRGREILCHFTTLILWVDEWDIQTILGNDLFIDQ